MPKNEQKSIHADAKLRVSPFNLSQSLFNGFVASQKHTHAAMTLNKWFTEQADLDIFLGQNLIQVLKLNHSGIALNNDSLRSARTVERNIGDGETKNGASVQRELAKVLGDHRHHTCIVRTR